MYDANAVMANSENNFICLVTKHKNTYLVDASICLVEHFKNPAELEL